MTSTTSDSDAVVTDAVDARVFLFGKDSIAAIAERLAEPGVLDGARGRWPGVGGAIQRLFDDRLAAVADGFLDVDLGGVAVAGWRLHQQLHAAARETLAAPGLISLVDLGTHTIECTWRPRVEVTLARAAVAHVDFGLVVTFDVTGLAAVVESGRLVRLGGGACRVTVGFSLGGRTLAMRSARFDPRLAVPLGDGIAIAPPADRGPRPDAGVESRATAGDAADPGPAPTAVLPATVPQRRSPVD